MKITLYTLFLIICYSCGQHNKEMLAEYQENNTSSTIQEVALEDLSEDNNYETINSDSKLANNLEKPIIRNGSLFIDSKDLKKTKANIDKLVKQSNAYYEQENTSSNSTYTNYELTIRIPSKHFDSFLEKIENEEDKINNKSINAKDVSLQYYDLESRLKSKRVYLERYQKMVGSAKNIKELLEIEEQIRHLVEDIESSESLLKSLKDQVRYSTLQITIQNKSSQSLVNENSYLSRIKDAFIFGWELIANIIIGIIGVWPILFIAITGIIGWKKLRSKR